MLSVFHWPLFGNEPLKQFLEKTIIQGSFAHAYAVLGPKGSGKRALVQQLVKNSLCYLWNQSRTDIDSKQIVVPCNACVHCKQFDHGIHPDVIMVEREVNQKTQKKDKYITVAQTRELQKKLNTATFLNLYKFAVIWDAEHLNAEASNALLKTLEEPSKNVIIILVAEDKDQLLPTVVSRCQLLTIKRVRRGILFDAFINGGLSRDQAHQFSAAVMGLSGLAREFLEEPDRYQTYQQKTQILMRCFQQPLFRRLLENEAFFKNLDSHDDVLQQSKEILSHWVFVLRDMMLCKILDERARSYITHVGCYDMLITYARQMTEVQLLRSIEYLLEVEGRLENNVNPKFIFDHFFIQLEFQSLTA